MTAYILVAAVIGILAMIQARNPKHKITPMAAIVIFSAFISLRYQVGYDWLGYEALWDRIPTASNIINGEPVYWDSRVEFGYQALNFILKSTGLGFHSIIFFTGLFNSAVIYLVIRKISPGKEVICIFVYFVVAAAPVQMNIIRQSVASSLILLSFLYLLSNKPVKSAISAIFAATFHVSTVIFYPIILLSRVKINSIALISLAVLSVAIFLTGSIGSSIFIEQIYGFGSIFESRLESYLSQEKSVVSPMAIALGVMHGVLFFIFFSHMRKSKQFDAYINVAMMLSLMMLISHFVFSDFPSVWNRTMAVALPWQLAAFWRTGVVTRITSRSWVPIFAMTTIFGCGLMYYQLSRPKAAAFVPYNTVVNVMINGDDGSGRFNTMRSIAEIEQGVR